MQDNARPHTSLDSRIFFENNGITLLDWAACSPDCNPIENLWGILVQRIYKNRRFDTVSILKESILKEWNSLKLSEIQSLTESFSKRLIAVVAAKGGEISKY